MTTTNNSTNMKKMSAKYLTIHPTLKELGIESLSQFEIEVNKRFGIPNEVILTNEKNQVINNWEYVQGSSQEMIEVYQLDISDEELLIVLASRNLRKRLKPSGRISLELLLQNCLKNTQFGTQLCKTLPGENVIEKIGKMLGSCYGTVEKDFLINKYAPQFIDDMDNGLCSLETAYDYAKQMRDKIKGKEKEIDDKSASSTPPSKKKKGEFAGDTKMIPCNPIIGITVRRYNAPPIDIDFDESFKVESRIDPVNKNAEHHKIINLDTQTIIDLHMKNIDKL